MYRITSKCTKSNTEFQKYSGVIPRTLVGWGLCPHLLFPNWESEQVAILVSSTNVSVSVNSRFIQRIIRRPAQLAANIGLFTTCLPASSKPTDWFTDCTVKPGAVNLLTAESCFADSD